MGVHTQYIHDAACEGGRTGESTQNIIKKRRKDEFTMKEKQRDTDR